MWNNLNQTEDFSHNTLSPLQGEVDQMSDEARNVPRLSREPRMFHVEHSDVHWDGTFARFKTFFLVIIFLGLFQAIIGIAQFFSQNSIELFWLWESQISPEILGVAKLVLHGEKYIRAYGLMPHPNILGGFLLFSIIITLLYQKLFHTCQKENCSTWNNFKIHSEEQTTIVPRLPADEVGGTISEKKEISFTQTEKSNLLFEFKTFTLLKNWVIKLFHVEHFIISPQPSPYKGEGANCSTPALRTQIVPRGTIHSSAGWNNLHQTPLLLYKEKVAEGRMRYENWLKILSIKFNINKKWLFIAIISIQSIALLLTFSKSALIGLILALIYIYIYVPHKSQLFHACPTEDCSTWNIFGQMKHSTLTLQTQDDSRQSVGETGETIQILIKLIRAIMFHVEHYKKVILFILIILVSFFIFAKPSSESLFVKSAQERIRGYKMVIDLRFYNNPCLTENCSTLARQENVPCLPRESKLFHVEQFRFLRGGTFWAGGTLITNPILGVGAGQGVILMQKFFEKSLESWEYQPIHNVFLIILAELGLIGLILFIWWLWKLFHACPVNSNCSTWNISKLYKVEHSNTSPSASSADKQPSPYKGEGAEYSTLTLRTQNVPRGTFCSSAGWNNSENQGQEKAEKENGGAENNKYILEHNNIILSNIVSIYFKGILIGFIFIMLFDHYLWDIQQGSLIFWLTAGFIAGISKK